MIVIIDYQKCNDNGVKRMTRGIFALQQALSSITKSRAVSLLHMHAVVASV